jgi:membrane-associated phospholipid phosphatase
MSVQIIALLFLAGVSLLLFFPLNTRTPRYLRRSTFERRIPFVPIFIVPYLAIFPYVVFSIFIVLFFTPVAARMYTSLIIAGLTAALIWYFFPSGVAERPRVTPRGLFTNLVAWTYAHDPRCNAFPSSHVFTTFLCSYYLTFAFPPHETLIWVFGTTVMGSTLLVKQHHIIDLIAGLLLAVTAIGASFFLLGALA